MKLCYINKENQKFVYNDLVRDLRYNRDCKTISFAEEYNGEEIVRLACTQHSKVDFKEFRELYTDSQRKKFIDDWVRLFTSQELPLKEVQLCTLTPQKVFDALCNQKSIESLRIKGFQGKNIEEISNLKNLKMLFIERASSITDISPLAELKNLEVLILGSTKKVTDYSPLGKLNNLKTFAICSYQIQNDVMTVENDSFIKDMSSLEYLDLTDAKILNRNFLTEENTKHFKFACFPI